MKAHVEILSGIVRVGPDTDAYGKPFEYAVAFVADGGVAKLKGLVSDGRMNIRHARACVKALKDIGLRPVGERLK